MKRKPILCLDFDGTVHQFSYGWQPKGPRGAVNIYDRPVSNAQRVIEEYLLHFDVQIFSSRSSYPGGIAAMKAWCQKWGFPHGIKFPKRKPNAHVFMDDRGYRFEGYWPEPIYLQNLIPWYENRTVPPWWAKRKIRMACRKFAALNRKKNDTACPPSPPMGDPR